MDEILKGSHLSAHFGGVAALHDVDVSFQSETVHAIVGANGAGKTTLLNVLTGAIFGFAGEVVFRGRTISGKSLPEIARMGIRRTFQTCQLVPTLSVRQNIMLGIEATRGARVSVRDFDSIVDALRLEPELDRLAGAATFSVQRRTEIGRALVAHPRVLLLDEPSSGLDRSEAERLADLIRKLARDGLAVGVIDHDVEFLHGIADHVTLLELGRLAQSTEVSRLDAGVRSIRW